MGIGTGRSIRRRWRRKPRGAEVGWEARAGEIVYAGARQAERRPGAEAQSVRRLGPYEVAYDVTRGYGMERVIIQP